MSPFVMQALFLVAIASISLVDAQFPRVCATLEAYNTHECCPPLGGVGSQCGESEGRGVCLDTTIIDLPHGDQYTLVNIDDRENWPERFFNRTCVCVGNYAGFDCSRCKFGWTGERCDQERPLAVRRNIKDLTEEDSRRFLNALDQSKTTIHPDYVIARDHYRNLLTDNPEEPNYVDVTIYDLFVWVHYYSVRDTLLGDGEAYTDIDFSHEGPAFATWHRMHLLNLEDDLRRMTGDESLAIPYWDFATGGDTCDICTDELVGGRHPTDPTLLSIGSRFADWDIVCLSLQWYDDNVKLCNGTAEGPIIRNPGGNVDRPEVQNLPRPGDVLSCLNVDSYDTEPYFSTSDNSFRNTLEGYANVDGQFAEGARTLHNLAHLFLNGTGGQTHASANDPIFVLLHAFTDAIFEAWLQRRDGAIENYPSQGAPIGHNLDYNMVPFFPPVTNRDMFLSSSLLGYTYDLQLLDFETTEEASGLEDEDGNEAPSFLYSIMAVAVFVLVICILVLMIAVIKKRRAESSRKGLYERISEDFEA